MKTINKNCSLNKAPCLELKLVTGCELETVWDQLVHKHHYLGCRKLLGRRLKYMAFVREKPVAALAWSAPAKQLKVRDLFIGWTPQLRDRFLDRLAANSRFVIFPWVQIPNLASYIMGKNLRRLRADWQNIYQEDLWLVETFVDPRYFRGTVYKASNWKYLGTTKGYTKQGQGYLYHGRVKNVFVYVLEPGIWDLLGCTSTWSVFKTLPQKVENCQSGVFAGYTSEKGYCFLDCQLYMPVQWFTDRYQDLREKNLIFSSKCNML